MNPNYETPMGMTLEPQSCRREGPQFPTMEEVEKWFDQNYCGIERLAIIAPPPAPGGPMAREHSQQRMSLIAEVAAPLRVRKSDWLRRDGNEEWYGPRVALVHAVWNHLKREHETALAYESDRSRKLDQELVKANKALLELRGEAMALSDQNQQMKRDIRLVRNVVMDVMGSLKKIRSLKKVVSSFRDLLAKELEIK